VRRPAECRQEAGLNRLSRPGGVVRLAPRVAPFAAAAVPGFGEREASLIILGPLIKITLVAIDLYIWVVIISAILSWLVAFNVVNTRNRFVYMVGDFLYRVTEPALRPIRRFVPSFGGVDITPVVLILGLWFVQMVLGEILYSLARAAG
jgi:YggT family protein